MDKYETAARLFGREGSAGESDAIANYLEFISSVESSGICTGTDVCYRTEEDREAVNNVLERIEDELNHLLGDTLDAINIAGLKISPDGMDKILDGLRAAIKSENTMPQNNTNSDMINL